MIKFRTTLMSGLIGLLVLTGCGGGEDVATAVGGGVSEAAPVKKVKLQMASAFPSSLPILGVGGVEWTEKVDRLSGGTLEIKFYEPNALVPGLEAIPAASKGSVEMAWASSGYYAALIMCSACLRRYRLDLMPLSFWLGTTMETVPSSPMSFMVHRISSTYPAI